jgi:hypothetical protein
VTLDRHRNHLANLPDLALLMDKPHRCDRAINELKSLFRLATLFVIR